MIKVTIDYKYRDGCKTYRTIMEMPDVDFDLIKEVYDNLESYGMRMNHVDISEEVLVSE